MKRVVERLNLRKALETDATRERLKMAGLRGQAPVVAFLFFRAALPIATAGLAFFYLFFVNSYDLAPLLRLVVSLGGAYIGFYLPNIFITNLIQRRQKAIKRAVSGFARPSAYLRAGRHVGRIGNEQGLLRNRTPVA